MSDDGAFGLALLLAALAGWVDVAGLGGSGGVFLSFMSGNTTDLAVALTQQEFARAATIGAIVVLFVAGVVIGELVEPLGGRGGQSLVLGIEALALGTGAAFRWPGLSMPAAVSLFPLVFAMGLQNATMHRAGGISIGLTYVTGTLVQIGRAIAGLMGGGGDGRKLGEYVALWLSLAAGAGLGALAMSVSTLAALATAAVAAGWLAFMTTPERG
jgi:uncharacterized membrane protein YoaK (UPF0700 family)